MTIKLKNMKSILYSVFTILLLSASADAQMGNISDIIKNKIDTGVETKSISADGVILYSQGVLSNFYGEIGYNAAWTEQKNIDDLLFNLNDSYNEGLMPTDYHLKKISRLSDEVKNNNDLQKLADLDLLMTDAALLYASHLILGKVDQSKIRIGWNVPSNKLPIDSESLLENALVNKTLSNSFDEIKPDYFMYTHLRNGLATYRNISENEGWPEVPKGQVLKLGVVDSRVLTLRDYLLITGDLQPEIQSENDSIYDIVVEEAVKSFQYRHNLNQDGIVGKGTLALINIPVEKRIEEIRINLERARWVIHHLPKDFLVVNIAGFNVRRIIEDSTVFYSRVIVGRHYHESPIFDGKMTYIELNPTWTLPYSIATKETLPKLKKNPDYLAKKNMIIMDRSGKELDPSTIDFDSLSRRNFPYTLRQKAGPHNALGEVKFMFPNKYAVYLHDTPARSLFAREDRAFSHGCIRLDDKWGLFLNLMGEKWNMERIEEVVKSEKTTVVKLNNPIQILLLYWTAGADKQDQLFFNKDVYDRDSEVLKQLDKPYKFLKAS